jgi:hypothetical protein
VRSLLETGSFLASITDASLKNNDAHYVNERLFHRRYIPDKFHANYVRHYRHDRCNKRRYDNGNPLHSNPEWNKGDKPRSGVHCRHAHEQKAAKPIKSITDR